MKTIRKEVYRPEFVEFMPPFERMEQGFVYISEKYNTSTHKCLCGCGQKVVMPLRHGDGIHSKGGWDLIKHENGLVSFTPSVGNFQQPCNTHYIMTKGVANFV